MASNKLSYYILLAVFNLHTSLAESGYFWHVTDFHYDPTYWTTQLSCNDDVPKPGLYGDYWCDSNWKLIEDSITNMAIIKKDVDFVIWTGDTVAHIADDNSSLAMNLEILQNVTSVLKEAFPEVKCLPSLGNHDFYPSNQADVVEDELYNKTADIWRPWINDADELKQFMKGGFYTMALSNTIRLVALNTNLYYHENRITKTMQDPAGQFAWMEGILTTAKKNGEKVMITAHIPPGILTPNFADWMYQNHQQRYVSILTNYSDIIVATYYGHDHSDGFKIMQDEKDDSKAVAQFVAPSVTPWRFRAGSLTGKPHNPGVRLVEYDKQTGKPINYVQYYINLTDANMNNKSTWDKLYDFKDTYKVDDMSVSALKKIFNKMKDDGGEELAQIYCNNALVSKEEKSCSEKNRFEIICGGELHEMDDAKKCVDKYIIGFAPFIRLDLACAIVSFVLIVNVIVLHYNLF